MTKECKNNKKSMENIKNILTIIQNKKKGEEKYRNVKKNINK